MVRGRTHHPHAFSARWRLELEREDPVPTFREIFGDDRPVEVEIGHGHGTFLIAASAARPDRNFLGVEWSRGRHLYTGERVAKRDLGNVRLLRRDAGELLSEQLAPSSVSTIHLYYPDPYWKRKQFGRRLVTKSFVRSVADVLEAGGRLLLKSDVPERFSDMVALFTAEPRLGEGPWEELAADQPDAVSNFERKAVEAGRPLGRAAFVRLP